MFISFCDIICILWVRQNRWYLSENLIDHLMLSQVTNYLKFDHSCTADSIRSLLKVFWQFLSGFMLKCRLLILVFTRLVYASPQVQPLLSYLGWNLSVPKSCRHDSNLLKYPKFLNLSLTLHIRYLNSLTVLYFVHLPGYMI